MTRIWQIQEAENELDEIIAAALQHGAQVIADCGVAVAVVLSYADYREMLIDRQTLSDFFGSSPLAGLDLDLARDPSPIRNNVR